MHTTTRTHAHTHILFHPSIPHQTQDPTLNTYKSRLPMPRSLILQKEETSVVGIESNGRGSSAASAMANDGPRPGAEACLD